MYTYIYIYIYLLNIYICEIYVIYMWYICDIYIYINMCVWYLNMIYNLIAYIYTIYPKWCPLKISLKRPHRSLSLGAATHQLHPHHDLSHWISAFCIREDVGFHSGSKHGGISWECHHSKCLTMQNGDLMWYNHQIGWSLNIIQSLEGTLDNEPRKFVRAVETGYDHHIG